MSISGVSGSSSSPAPTAADREVAVLKKEREVEKQAAESLIQLVKEAPSPSAGRIDTYA